MSTIPALRWLRQTRLGYKMHTSPTSKKNIYIKDKEEFYSFTVVKIQIPPLEIKRTSCDYTPGVQKRNSNVYYICAWNVIMEPIVCALNLPIKTYSWGGARGWDSPHILRRAKTVKDMNFLNLLLRIERRQTLNMKEKLGYVKNLSRKSKRNWLCSSKAPVPEICLS